ncbi:hypothetical protein FACS1894163_10930 [Spirochaetia bacterium]|nr:hypothetical protein FACS1894163_10930 [Spirochaetia bacterium]
MVILIDTNVIIDSLTPGIDKQHVINAIENKCFDDLEDCLQAECAASVGADYIVTRNTADFTHSPVPALSPESFLEAELRMLSGEIHAKSIYC